MRECELVDVYINYQYILIYREDDGTHHTIYMKEKKNKSFNCINSWGDLKPEVDVPFGKVIKIYKIGGRWISEELLEGISLI